MTPRPLAPDRAAPPARENNEPLYCCLRLSTPPVNDWRSPHYLEVISKCRNSCKADKMGQCQRSERAKQSVSVTFRSLAKLTDLTYPTRNGATCGRWCPWRLGVVTRG